MQAHIRVLGRVVRQPLAPARALLSLYRPVKRRGQLSAHENLEHAEHVEHASQSNKKIALQIAILALFLAFSETLGKSAQTAAIADNIKASDTWNFFQAKTIRQTSLRVAAEEMTAQLPTVNHEEAK